MTGYHEPLETEFRIGDVASNRAHTAGIYEEYLGTANYAHAVIGSLHGLYHAAPITDSRLVLIGNGYTNHTLTGIFSCVSRPLNDSTDRGSLLLRCYHFLGGDGDLRVLNCGGGVNSVAWAGVFHSDTYAAINWSEDNGTGSLYFYRSLRSYTYLN